MKFTIWVVQNGFLLNVTKGSHAKSFIFKLHERMRMLAYINDLLGEEPDPPSQEPEEDL